MPKTLICVNCGNVINVQELEKTTTPIHLWYWITSVLLYIFISPIMGAVTNSQVIYTIFNLMGLFMMLGGLGYTTWRIMAIKQEKQCPFCANQLLVEPNTPAGRKTIQDYNIKLPEKHKVRYKKTDQ